MNNIENTDQLPVDDQRRLRVHLVPMPSGDNPWRTREEYLNDQKRDTARFYIIIGSFILSVIAATLSWVQMAEARKERIKAQEIMQSTKQIAQILVNFSEVDHAIGYTINSFKVREIAAPYLYEKVKEIAESLDIPVDNKINIAFKKWSSLKDASPEKEEALKELEKIIIEKLK